MSKYADTSQVSTPSRALSAKTFLGFHANDDSAFVALGAAAAAAAAAGFRNPRNAEIPKIIHQTYKTSNESEFPASWQHALSTWRTMNPNFGHRLWSDEAVRNLVISDYPHLLDVFDSYPNNIQRADLGRWVHPTSSTHEACHAHIHVTPTHVHPYFCQHVLVGNGSPSRKKENAA